MFSFFIRLCINISTKIIIIFTKTKFHLNGPYIPKKRYHFGKYSPNLNYILNLKNYDQKPNMPNCHVLRHFSS